MLGNKILGFIERYILLKNKSIMTKLFVFSSILVVFPVLAVGLISYKTSSIQLEEEFEQSSRQIMEQVETHIEYYEQDFEITSLKIINSPDFKVLLGTDHALNNQEVAESARNVLKNAAYSRPDISNITAILDNGLVIDTLGQRNYYPATKIEDEYWYSSLPKTGMVMLVSRTLKIKDKEEPVISLVRRLYNPHTLKPIGILVIDINFRRIREISSMVTLSENGYFFILDNKGHYVYHPDSHKLGTRVEYTQLLKLGVEESGSLIIENGRKEFVSYSLSSNLGWRFFTAVPYQDLRGPIKEIGTVITWTIVISLIFAYFWGTVFTVRIVRPIRRLQRYMKEVEVGNLSGRIKVESSDEIGQLTRGFNNTVERLSNLLEEVYVSKLNEAELSLYKKETELKVLQSQINPHFLHNSLETIRGMALEEGKEEIASISYSLGKLLRYNLRNNLPIVSFGEEIKVAELYLQIQKYRFEERFTYSFVIPDWVKDQKVVKFSLQPILENCFAHAFGTNFENIKITIKVELSSEANYIIRIIDNGKGMDEEVLEELDRKLAQHTINLDGQHIGIMNVHQRIRYLFGEQYGVSIESQKGVGTQVNITLPLIEDKDVVSNENDFTRG
ncbi:sensor histidine kinase [Bacillus sp. HNG]|uniref:sensor histidine kinase n=1 Tax=Bacillus sp. HNG TaxID=2293325 RepID=UPI000E2E585F|nr:sensor histidine kinase [Bacillus sp. HNG]RFB12057.1 sensor histidine kinase [Bacillus sp. HNG]